MNDIFSNMWLGLSVAATPEGLLYCTLGVFVGMVVGVLPGLGSLAAISILYPITFHVEPHYAIIMLAGIYYGTTYGGKTTAILLNVPGETDAAVVCFDGHPMAKQGRAGVALFMSTMAAFQGAAIGIAIVMLFSPVIASAALSFGSPEYFALMAIGLLATTAMSDNGPAKSIAMVLFGIVLGLAGTDVNSGVERFTFGLTSLQDGVSMVVIAMGLFGVSEIIFSFATTTAVVEKISMRRLKRDHEQRWRIANAALADSLPGLQAVSEFGGTNFLLTDPKRQLQADALARAALARGIVIESVAPCYSCHAQGAHRFRIGVSSIGQDRIRPGLALLADLVAELRSTGTFSAPPTGAGLPTSASRAPSRKTQCTNLKAGIVT